VEFEAGREVLRDREIRNKVAFDLDGVLIDIHQELVNNIRDQTGCDLSNHTEYSMIGGGVTRANFDMALKRIYSNYKSTIIAEGAQELIRKLWEKVKEPIMIVTARRAQFATETHAVVCRVMGKVPYCLIFSNGFGNKALYLRDYLYFVEDNGETARYLAEKCGKTIFLISKQYNAGVLHSRVISVDGLRDLLPLVRLFVS